MLRVATARRGGSLSFRCKGERNRKSVCRLKDSRFKDESLKTMLTLSSKTKAHKEFSKSQRKKKSTETAIKLVTFIISIKKIKSHT